MYKLYEFELWNISIDSIFKWAVLGTMYLKGLQQRVTALTEIIKWRQLQRLQYQLTLSLFSSSPKYSALSDPLSLAGVLLLSEANNPLVTFPPNF